MIASSLLSNVVPVLKKDDTCAQALGWMDLFRVSHLPVLDGETYVGLLSDEIMYAHGSIHDPIGKLDIPREMTFVYEDVHMYDVIGVASSRLLSVVPVLNRKEVYQGAILLTDILHNIDKLLCIDDPGGIIVLEVNKIDYNELEYFKTNLLSYTSQIRNNISNYGDTIDTSNEYKYESLLISSIQEYYEFINKIKTA